MVLCHAPDGRAHAIPVEPGRRCRHAKFSRVLRAAGKPAVPAARRQHKRLAMMDRGQLAIRCACHDHEPVLIAAPQQQAAHAHHPAVAKLDMPWPLWRRPFIPPAGNDKAAARGEGIAEGRLLCSRFHAGIDQKAPSLAGRRQAPCHQGALRLQPGAGDDQRLLRRRHIPARLKIVQHGDAKAAHQLLW